MWQVKKLSCSIFSCVSLDGMRTLIDFKLEDSLDNI